MSSSSKSDPEAEVNGGSTSEVVLQQRKKQNKEKKRAEAYDDTYLEEEKIHIPNEVLEKSFSWRALWLFTGECMT